MSLNFSRTRDLLSNFQFGELFIEELGWSHPRAKKTVSITVDNQEYPCQRIAEVSGVAVLEVTTTDIPDAKLRRDIHQQVIERIAENLLIFVDGGRTRSLWYWVKREGSKSYIRDHLYIKGQPGDLFLGKLAELVLDITDFEDGEPSVVEVAHRLQKGFDIEKITKKFYQRLKLSAKPITSKSTTRGKFILSSIPANPIFSSIRKTRIPTRRICNCIGGKSQIS